MKNNRTTAVLLLLVFLVVVAVVIIFLTGLDNSDVQSRRVQNVTVSAAPIIAESPTPAPSEEPTPTPTTAPTTVPVYYPPATSAPASTSQPVNTVTPMQGGSTSAVVSVPSGTSESNTSGTAGNGTTGSSDVAMVPVQELVPGSTATPADGTATGGNTGTVQVIPVGSSLGSGTFRSDTGTSLNIHADWTAVVSGEKTVDVTVTAYVDSYSLYTTASPQALSLAVDGQYVSLASPAIDYDGSAGQRTTLINNRTFTLTFPAGENRDVPVEVVWLYRGTYAGVSLETVECGGNIRLSR